MVSEEFVNFIPKDDRLANLRDANPLETIWIIVGDEVRQQLRFAWKNVNLDTLW